MNGFVAQQLTLGSKQPIHQLKQCNKCDEMKPPEGGIQMSPSKWHCAACWTKRAIKRS
jgi:formylmethanofuran dehydrogenase subunit E